MENENQKLKITGQELAKQIVERFGTNDGFVIAKETSVKIVYASWFTVTIGEFDRKNKTIYVNLNANETYEKIIAHELGHFFAQDLNLDKREEENFCHEFARSLPEIKPESLLKETGKIAEENEYCKL